MFITTTPKGGFHNESVLSRQMIAVPDLCCIVAKRSVESIGRVFDPVVCSARAVFEQDKDGRAIKLPCLFLPTLSLRGVGRLFSARLCRLDTG